jgi:hypothetical protein
LLFNTRLAIAQFQQRTRRESTNIESNSKT